VKHLETTAPQTTVVNIRHIVPFDVYIGRATRRGRREPSIWANPFLIGTQGEGGQGVRFPCSH
jgi:hypothetical protein